MSLSVLNEDRDELLEPTGRCSVVGGARYGSASRPSRNGYEVLRDLYTALGRRKHDHRRDSTGG